MQPAPLPLTATLAAYEAQALTLDLPPDDARSALAKRYDFADWQSLSTFVAAIARRDPAVYPFEAAVDAVVEGDLPTLQSLLHNHPDLVHARSTRVTHFDPSVHGATLLHYVAANGTEGYRQKSPANAVAIAAALLDAGAAVDSLAHLYGGQCSTMSLLVSSHHPAQAGVQVALVDLLVAHGAAVTNLGTGNWVSPLETALVFGYRPAAEALMRHGAPITLPAAAALGLAKEVQNLLPTADPISRHRALALAAQSGQLETTTILLDAGEDPNRFNPPGTHGHTPPIHQAIWNGHLAVVRLLVERGARLDIADTVHHGTPLGWAHYGGQHEIVKYLESLSDSPECQTHAIA